MLPIAIQLYSLRDDAEKDLKGTLQKVKEMGYEGVEFAGLYGYSAADVKAILDEVGLVAMSAHVPYVEMIADPQGVLADYAALGCKYVAVPYMTEEYRMGAEKGEEAVEGMRKLAEVAQGLGMTLLYHNHDFEFEKLDGEYKLDLLYKAIPDPLLQTEVDTCWVKVAGEDPAAYVRKYSGRAPVVHLKDFWMEGSDADGAYELIGIEKEESDKQISFEFRALGKGMQDIPSLVAAAQDAGAGWVVVEQDQPSAGTTAEQCARASIEYLKSL